MNKIKIVGFIVTIIAIAIFILPTLLKQRPSQNSADLLNEFKEYTSFRTMELTRSIYPNDSFSNIIDLSDKEKDELFMILKNDLRLGVSGHLKPAT